MKKVSKWAPSLAVAMLLCLGLAQAGNSAPAEHAAKQVESQADVWNLTGLNVEQAIAGQTDIVLALDGYRNGKRRHPTMTAQAESFSDQDMLDIAAYFSGIGTMDSPASTAAPDAAAVCVACHGQAGMSPSPSFPHLAGQHEDYLVEALRQYQSGQRTDPSMTALLAELSPDDIDAIASFYANAEGLLTPSR